MNVVTAHPKYPNDPLALVLIELRHPRTEPPVPSAISILKEELARWTPILEQEEVRQVNLETGEHTAHSQKKLVARDRRTAITFRPDAMTLEVTDYPGWEEFRSIVHAMVTARQDVAPVDGCIRIGLRYINEIRASLAEPSGWAYWVAESLLGPGTQLADLKLTTTAQRHVIQCEGPEPGDSLTLRYAGARGAVIQSTPFLQRLKEPPAEGDFFLIDIDSAWSDLQGHPSARRPPGGRGRRKAPHTHRPTVRIADNFRTPYKGAATTWAGVTMTISFSSSNLETTPPLATAITASTSCPKPPHRPRCSTAPMSPTANSRNSTGKPATHGGRRTWLSWSQDRRAGSVRTHACA